MRRSDPLLTLVAALLAVLAMACALAGPARAQTVTNVASATWVEGTQTRSTTSNAVSFQITQPSVTIQAFRPLTGGSQIALNDPLCGGVPLSLAGRAGALAAVPTTAISPGSPLIFQIFAPGLNRDGSAIDRIDVTLSTGADRETLTVFETGPDTGIFAAAIPTRATPPAPAATDCALGISAGQHIEIDASSTSGGPVIISALVDVLADPYGVVFDSEDGSPVSGARVTLVDAATGAPARVFADDGLTPWPSTVTTGGTVIDGAGNSYSLLPGEYRFPLAALGSYRLVVEPPSPYTAPSGASPAQLAALQRPDGNPFTILPASYGESLTLASTMPVRVDIPLDHPAVAVTLTKTASRQIAAPGDAVFYTATLRNPSASRAKTGIVFSDTPAADLRLNPASLRLNGVAVGAAATIAPDGRTFQIAVGTLAPDASAVITYAMTVRSQASQGYVNNDAQTTDSRGLISRASAAVRIERDALGGRMTLIGRITDGACAVGAARRGIAGVRVMLEDGSFAITDADGRYHFEGLVPGTHVVQAAPDTLPEGGEFVDCSKSTRSAGKANSRFVIGQGGSLLVADFAAIVPSGALPAADPVETPSSDRSAAGGETDWLAMGDGPNAFLFPQVDHNPRAPAVRVVIRHRKDENVELRVDGKPADPLAFDGKRVSPQGFAVSIWRGIPLLSQSTRIDALVRRPDGSSGETLSRTVHFADTPARVEILPGQSRLIADGKHRPIVALRVIDSSGRPVHAGLTGAVTINAPYESAAALDAARTRSLSGLDRAAPTWVVKGDDGIAYVELAPTMISGPLHLDFEFADRTVRRRQKVETWIVPGRQKWTLVGLAEGHTQAGGIAKAMETGGRFDSDLGKHGRVAFYAKGRVLGRFLLTAAYDSAKQKDGQRLLGAIDPRAYYTVFADASDRRFDAASREKLYVRIESRGFYALYGDFLTGFDQTELARYQRTMTGAKAEAQLGPVHLQGFAARSGSSHRRDEFQGGGISGPYRLSSRAPVPNSETVTLEVRDLFRSEIVVSRRSLTRFVDYDIDLLAGTISFKAPVLSRDEALNPQFIVVEYDIAGISGGEINAGARAAVTVGDRFRIGATVISDTSASGNGVRSDLAAIDVKAMIGPGTELRAESALSSRDSQMSDAWLVELEHHADGLDLLGYARSADAGFGLGQTSTAERGRRKIGLDARYKPSDDWSFTGSLWRDDSLTDDTRREAIQFGTAYRVGRTEARLSLASFRDRLADGRTANSTVLEGGLTQRALGNRLELSASSSLALGKSESIDLPARHRLGASFAVTPAVKLAGTYEIATGDSIDARTARIGIDASPWKGARLVTSLGQQDLSESGKRSFAAFGLSQSLQIGSRVTVDATLDSSKTLGAFDPSRLVNPGHPAASGGYLGDSGTLAEDFTAITLGSTYRANRWIATVRGEWRDGQFADRKGMTAGAIRQLGEGSMAGGGFTWTRSKAAAGGIAEVLDGAIAAAHRPANSAFAFLGKLEFRSDTVTGAVDGEAGAAGRTALAVTGNARSRRVMGSLSTNWSPRTSDHDQQAQRTEIGLFVGLRHTFESYQGFDLAGTTVLGGLDARIGLASWLDVGGQASVRKALDGHTTDFAFGPAIGISPAQDMLVTIGYNVSGFRDRDFAAARNTSQGVFAAVRMKFDSDSFRFLGLGR